MSTPTAAPPVASDTVTIEVDGQKVVTRKGAMIIHATDAHGDYVPRFCYHPKLSIAANCRMCLVEVEKAPKPMPACATPVMEGMKVFTKSPKALAAQKATMEFLLINHPLDCPICDQGGECELQDLAMGYGQGLSRFTEQKRVVADHDIGPLISTDMTRCIHCTRCVRFGEEVAGMPELGATGRGEDLKIGTYIAKSVDHELSGNVIDLCPVGALNSKPFRMRGRSWEMQQHALVSPHDALGSNLWAHALRGQLLRVVPRENEAINETWLSDRDRFGYEGLHAADRLKSPLLKRDGKWSEVSWEVALEAAANGIKDAVEQSGSALGTLVAPNCSVEEAFLAQKLSRALGSENIDSRLGQRDFRDDAHAPQAPVLPVELAAFEQLAGVLVVGADLRKDAPLFGHRLRKLARKGGAVGLISSRTQRLEFPVAAQLAVDHGGAVQALAEVLVAVASTARKPVPAHLAAASSLKPGEEAKRLAAILSKDGNTAVVLGPWALAHPQLAELRALAAGVAELSGASFGYLPAGANAVGVALAGALPHRGPSGAPRVNKGLDARAMIEQPRRAYLVCGAEPELDHAGGAAAAAALAKADCVVMLSPFISDAIRAYATVVLPVASFGECSGTVVNAEGRWQGYAGAVTPPGDARPMWKVLRVLGNLCGKDGFDHQSSAEVRAELEALTGARAPSAAYAGAHALALPAKQGGLRAVDEVPLYAADALVRRAESLQRTSDARTGRTLRMSPATAARHGLAAGDRAKLLAGNAEVSLATTLDAGVPDDVVIVPRGLRDTVAVLAALATEPKLKLGKG
jgi:NADH-quinone oxidoreductase subunit G